MRNCVRKHLYGYIAIVHLQKAVQIPLHYPMIAASTQEWRRIYQSSLESSLES